MDRPEGVHQVKGWIVLAQLNGLLQSGKRNKMERKPAHACTALANAMQPDYGDELPESEQQGR